MEIAKSAEQNPLTRHLPEPMDRLELAQRLHKSLPLDEPLSTLSIPVRIQRIRALSSWRVPSPADIRIASTIQHMIHTGYRKRDPRLAPTWQTLYEPETDVVAEAALLTGPSGTGKSTMMMAGLETFPKIIDHDAFPKLATGLRQVVWLKASAHRSGQLAGLAINLLDALARVLGPQVVAGVDRSRPNATLLSRRAIQLAKSHFLGMLVIDEAQNLFKLSTVADRRRTASRSKGPAPLRLVEDETLKFLLEFSNDSGIPLILVGTPDVLRGLQSRVANTTRLAIGGHFELSHPESSSDPFFSKILLPQLVKHQWIDRPIEMSPELRDCVYRLTGGIPKIVVALWMHVQAYVLERDRQELRLADLELAFMDRMGFLRPAIDALLSGDPTRMSTYEDLMAQFQ